jgi:tRNA modification GTPase
MKIDTITAVATAPGQGGVGIVRVSGPQAKTVCESVVGCVPKTRTAHFSTFKNSDGEALDEGLAIFFEGPNSFTGEDVLELQGHGGPVVLDRVLKATLETQDVRMARAGEFSERAFLNDKLDLAQAESIADLIEASSEQAAQSAMRSLQGEFSQKVYALNEAVIELRIFVEAAIDFPEEEIDFLSDGKVEGKLNRIIARVAAVQAQAQTGVALKEGVHVALAGKPNAGKSSLLNALAGDDRAIVTEVAGTTRDVMREHIHIEGVPLHILDTAGLRDTQDIVEKEGVRRAKDAIETADLVLWFVDENENIEPKENVLYLHNKIDMSGQKAKTEGDHVYLSAKTHEGLDLLKTAILNKVGIKQHTEGQFMARRRHLDALDASLKELHIGEQCLKNQKAGELLAENLRHASNALSEITGEFTSDDLLGRIFSSFCIGK